MYILVFTSSQRETSAAANFFPLKSQGKMHNTYNESEMIVIHSQPL